MEQSFAELAAACRVAPPTVALVLGSGMGELAARVTPEATVPFAAIPGLPATSVHGHRGRLTLGTWNACRVLLFEGRLHFYEGHPWSVVERPMQVAAELGASVALLTNAAGGIADPLGPGALMALTDHMECNRPCWWREPGPGGVGGDRPSPYSPRLVDCLQVAAEDAGVELHAGIYAALTGPTYETPAEIRALKAWGADAVGMSTAREAMAAHAAGLECAAISVIANKGCGLTDEPLHHGEVLTVVAAAAERLARVIELVLGRLPIRGQ
jgi:purine-nucleoside phosphorylase